MSRTEALSSTLRSLRTNSPEIEASAVVSEDGLIIASALPENVEETRVAAMSAAVLSIGMRAVTELRKGKLEQLIVKGHDGYLVLSQAGPHAVLLALTSKDAKLGLVFFEMARAGSQVQAILS